ncbi:MAG: hypothetical protein ABUK01_02140 [Leptospirales bacterium]
MKSYFVLFLSISLFFSVYGGPIQQKYNQLDNQEKHKQLSDDEKATLLQDNLTVAVKLSLLRYYKYCGYADIKISNGQYEKASIHKFMYYITYNEFTGYVIYENDPETYRVLPIDEKFYVEPGSDVVRIGDDNCDTGSSKTSTKTDTNAGTDTDTDTDDQ